MMTPLMQQRFRQVIFLFAFTLLLPLSTSAKQKLQFKHNSPTNLKLGTSFLLRGQVQNNDDLDEVYLNIRSKGKTRYRPLRMTLYNGDYYKVLVPGALLKKPGLEYYVNGIDIDKANIFLAGTPQSPLQIQAAIQTSKASSKPSLSTTKPQVFKPDDKEKENEDEETVISASRKQQRVQQAPAVITVITAAEIKDSGWRSVQELLRYIVGIDINNTGHWVNIGIRGVNPRLSYGDKLIILLDGHNMSWRQFNRNFLSPSWISIDSIKRIEIIRGPGSSLWGANALVGVINIISKVNHDLNGLTGTIGGSPFSSSYFMSLQGGQEILDGVSFRASFSLHQDNRSPVLAPIYEFKKKGVTYVPQGDQNYNQSFHAQLRWKNIKLSFHQSRYDPTAPMSSFSINGGDDSRFVTDRYIVKFSWAALLGQWGDFVLWSAFDRYGFSQGTAYESKPFSPTERSLVKMTAKDSRFDAGVQFGAHLLESENVSLSSNLGLDFEYLNATRWHFPEVWSREKLAIPVFNNIHVGAFLQAQISLWRKIELTLGGRVDYDQFYPFVLTPRAALVITPGLGFYSKLLYGRAFKAPSIHDLFYFRKNKFYGNPNLSPESVHTLEVQLGWFRRNIMAFSVNGYLSLFQDLITYTKKSKTLDGESNFPESQRPKTGATYSQKANLASLTTYGVEAELRLFPVKRLRINASVGVFMGQDQKDKPLEYAANWTGSLTFSYRISLPYKKLKLQLAAGFHLTGPKRVPNRGFTGANFGKDAFIPPEQSSTGKKQAIPTWDANGDPSTATPLAFRSFASVQILNIMDKIDFVLRLNNVANRDIYDAYNFLLYPQKKLELMAWLRMNY